MLDKNKKKKRTKLTLRFLFTIKVILVQQFHQVHLFITFKIIECTLIIKTITYIIMYCIW